MPSTKDTWGRFCIDCAVIIHPHKCNSCGILHDSRPIHVCLPIRKETVIPKKRRIRIGMLYRVIPQMLLTTIVPFISNLFHRIIRYYRKNPQYVLLTAYLLTMCAIIGQIVYHPLVAFVPIFLFFMWVYIFKSM